MMEQEKDEESEGSEDEGSEVSVKNDKSELDDKSITCNSKKSVLDLSEDVNKLYKVNLVDKTVKDKVTKNGSLRKLSKVVHQ